MTPVSWITLALIGGFVWGGFAFLLVRAIRAEGRKERRRERQS
ncbi:MAG TPA: hypothetical protein VMT16_16025 [Thermoanaerobaculia bacterium]|nr:hypothetical protein [Thermoanaerobaculia bacterium]